MENNIHRNGGAVVPNGLRAIWLDDNETPIIVCNQKQENHNEIKYMIKACEDEG